MDQFTTVNEKLIFTESPLKDKTALLEELQDRHTSEVQKLNNQLQEVSFIKCNIEHITALVQLNNMHVYMCTCNY